MDADEVLKKYTDFIDDIVRCYKKVSKFNKTIRLSFGDDAPSFLFGERVFKVGGTEIDEKLVNINKNVLKKAIECGKLPLDVVTYMGAADFLEHYGLLKYDPEEDLDEYPKDDTSIDDILSRKPKILVEDNSVLSSNEPKNPEKESEPKQILKKDLPRNTNKYHCYTYDLLPVVTDFTLELLVMVTPDLMERWSTELSKENLNVAAYITTVLKDHSQTFQTDIAQALIGLYTLVRNQGQINRRLGLKESGSDLEQYDKGTSPLLEDRINSNPEKYTPAGLPIVNLKAVNNISDEMVRRPEESIQSWSEIILQENPKIGGYIGVMLKKFDLEEQKSAAYYMSGLYQLLRSQAQVNDLEASR